MEKNALHGNTFEENANLNKKIFIIVLFLYCIPLFSRENKSQPNSISVFYQIKYQKTIEKIIRNELKSYVSTRDSHKSTFTLEEKNLIKKIENIPSKNGIFISLFNKKTTHLIGCMGSLVPSQKNLYDELIHWTNMAFLFDTRVPSKEKNNINLKNLVIVVSIIKSVDAIDKYEKVNPIEQGLMIRYNSREALVLPGEARTYEYARKMVLKKLKLNYNIQNDKLLFFKIEALRFGSGKYLM